jgi:diguanylate cyclase (GGDEF)-like protein
MKIQHTTTDIPDFLIKSTMGCSLTMILVLLPFAVNDFIAEQYVITIASTMIITVCGVNVWYGSQGKYNLWLNTWLVAPIGGFTVTYALVKLGAPGSYWPFLVIVAYYFILPEQRAWFFNLLSLAAIIPSAWYVLEPAEAFRFTAVLLGVSLFAYISMRVISVLHRLLHGQAVTDTLTGLYNRTLLEDALQHASAQSRRSGVPMTLISFDIDGFKSINDTHGHDIGDRILETLGELLRARARSSDMVFRIGGDEFLFLAHNTDEHHGARVAEKLRHEVEQSLLLHDRQITLSIGVSRLHKDMDVTTWLKSCDVKLYCAKENGRNQVVV